MSINLTFFKEYTKLDNLLKQVYHAPEDKAGVTHYLETMQQTPESVSRKIPDWEKSYKKLRYLRHMRNNMAHNADAFDTEKATKEDVAYVRRFIDRVLACEDPLSPVFGRKKKHDEHSNSGCIFALIAALVILLILCSCVYFFKIPMPF